MTLFFDWSDMLPDMHGEVRARLTPEAQLGLALTCKAEFAFLPRGGYWVALVKGLRHWPGATPESVMADFEHRMHLARRMKRFDAVAALSLRLAFGIPLPFPGLATQVWKLFITPIWLTTTHTWMFGDDGHDEIFWLAWAAKRLGIEQTSKPIWLAYVTRGYEHQSWNTSYPCERGISCVACDVQNEWLRLVSQILQLESFTIYDFISSHASEILSLAHANLWTDVLQAPELARALTDKFALYVEDASQDENRKDHVLLKDLHAFRARLDRPLVIDREFVFYD